MRTGKWRELVSVSNNKEGKRKEERKDWYKEIALAQKLALQLVCCCCCWRFMRLMGESFLQPSLSSQTLNVSPMAYLHLRSHLSFANLPSIPILTLSNLKRLKRSLNSNFSSKTSDPFVELSFHCFQPLISFTLNMLLQGLSPSNQEWKIERRQFRDEKKREVEIEGRKGESDDRIWGTFYSLDFRVKKLALSKFREKNLPLFFPSYNFPFSSIHFLPSFSPSK